MMHIRRTFRVTEIDSIAKLAHALVEQSWTLCTGFRHGDLLFLNDSLSEDTAQEYAVFELRPGRPPRQIETFTASWMTVNECRDDIERLLDPDERQGFGVVHVRMEHSDDTCGLCA
jgi:hypothetical protein